MKNIFLLFAFSFSLFAFSQAPEGINYQAVMRNNSGNLVTNSTVAIRVQIRQGTASGSAVYQERQSITTTSQGLINMVIGAGTPQVGTFNNINWAVGPFFVNLAVDFSNGVNYQDFGTQQLMSVPYALYAKKSGAQLNQWRYGNTVPVNSLGVLGDFYLDVVTGNVYYKNSTTTWVLTGNIKGPVGPSGTTGAQGAQGIQGLNGSQGIQGATGAQGTQGIQGVAGTNGTNGTNGQNTLVKTITEAAGANCTSGGVKIEYGLDANNNGTLDLSEINATLTRYVCNGATGAQGAQGLQGATGSAGTNGAQGIQGFAGPTGSQGPIGLTGPAGANGAQGIQGVAGAAGANGTNGADGKNTLAKTTTEAAGANCTTGGVKIEYGLDANSNATLDVSEINATLTKYVCNGAVGATGAQGIQGLTGSQGIQGVAGTNGTNGADGKNTLAKTTTEAAGANCTSGGVKIEYGLDANNNGILDVSEMNATLTKYVCNGAVGAQGIQGVAGAAGTNGTNGAQGIQGGAGPTGPQGVAGTNGTNGLNALIKTTNEPAGSNCANGGTKIETGLDANSNGVLDASEVNTSQTQFVCNGQNSAGGFQSNHGSFQKTQGLDSVWTIPSGVSLVEFDLRGGDGSHGQNLSTCAYNQNGPAWGCPGGQGASCKILLAVSTGDIIQIKSGQDATSPSNMTTGTNCNYGGGSAGNNGTASWIKLNGNIVITANGGTGGNGFYCQCASGSASCNTPGASGTIIGPEQNYGGMLISQGTLGGGIVFVRY